MRKGWDNLSAPYRRRLERRGITRLAYERGDSLTRARGHFITPSTPRRRIIHDRQRAESEAWLRLRGRVRRLQAGESIRREYLVTRKIRTTQALEDTVRMFESMEARYVEEPEAEDYLSEYSEWYEDMHELYGEQFEYPDLDVFYHGTTKG